MGSLLRRHSRAQALLVTGLDWFDGVSHRLFVSHNGAYSVERLYALESYCSLTSNLRVVAVCLLFSLPPLLVPIALEFIPLQNPYDGWRANHGFWIRVFFSSCAVGLGAILQINALVPDLGLSAWTMFHVCIAPACVYTVVMLGIAVLWAFPTPFGLIIGAVPWTIAFVSVFVLTVGVKRLRSEPNLCHQVIHQVYMICVQASLVIVYSVFSAAYNWLRPEYKMFSVLLLPMIKLVMQHIVARTMKDLEEYQPGIVVFCVGVFNALYMAKCMQSASSRLIYAMIMAWDIFQSFLAYRRLHKTMDRLHVLAQSCNRGSLEKNLLKAIVSISLKPEVLQYTKGRSQIRIRSPIKPRIPTKRMITLIQFTTKQAQQIGAPLISSSRIDSRIPSRFGPTKIVPARSKDVKSAHEKGSPSVSPEQRSQYRSFASVQPMHTQLKEEGENVRVTRILSTTRTGPKHQIMAISLQLLFEWEFHVLVEYVESIVPMLYAIFVMIVCHLPSAEYYPETRGRSVAQVEVMVLNITVYACLEILSFLLMQICVKWKSGLSPAFILAFVIENQAQELSGRLFVWYAVLLQLTLPHNGVDFSFHFDGPKPKV